MGPCAKVVVKATLILPDGSEFFGENSVLFPQATCPRKLGEGYGPCHEICEQPGHAEMVAMRAASRSGHSVLGGRMFVQHKRICLACEDAMRAAGLHSWHCEA